MMRRIDSRIDVNGDDFSTNRSHYQGLLETLQERMQWAIDGGPKRDRSIERHLARGKVMVRDRIDRVIDDASPFVELSTLAGYGQYNDEAPGAGIVTGIGLVHGVPWMFIANDATVKGGSLLPYSWQVPVLTNTRYWPFSAASRFSVPSTLTRTDRVGSICTFVTPAAAR